MKSLIVCFSFHHNNTLKVAQAMAKVLDAQVKTPRQTSPEELLQFDLVGFGSGIYGEKHHESLLELADKLPEVTGKKAFIFSTSFVGVDSLIFGKVTGKFHTALREKLQTKGYTVVGEFNCKGFNTNRIYGRFGGMNKGRPNAEDLKHAEEFALKLKQST
jgi:flavodoxin